VSTGFNVLTVIFIYPILIAVSELTCTDDSTLIGWYLIEHPSINVVL